MPGNNFGSLAVNCTLAIPSYLASYIMFKYISHPFIHV